MTTGDRRREKDRRESMRCRRRALALVACFLLSGGAPFNEKRSQRGAGMRIGGGQGPHAGLKAAEVEFREQSKEEKASNFSVPLFLGLSI